MGLGNVRGGISAGVGARITVLVRVQWFWAGVWDSELGLRGLGLRAGEERERWGGAEAYM